MITFRIDNRNFIREMKAFEKKSHKAFLTGILTATLDMEKNAKLRVRDYTKGSKVKSGFLINSIHKKITNKGLTGEVISGASYSQAFEEGTRPHVITVKNKKVLAGPKRGAPEGWEISPKSAAMGYAVYGKRVFHPGTEPRPFLFPAWKKACQYLETLIRRAL